MASVNVNTVNQSDLLTKLNDTAYQAASAAQMAAAQEQVAPTEFVVTFYSPFGEPIAEVNDYIEATVEFERNAIETATIVMKHTDNAVPIAMTCYEKVVPVTIELGYMRWSGRIDTYDLAFKDGKYEFTVQCMGDYAWFSKMLVWPNFLLPIQAQWPTRSVFIGPAITCIKTMISEQAFRLQSGLWELVNTLLSGQLDWNAWFGTFLQSNGNLVDMLMTPMVVVPTNPIFDTSKWISLNGRMDKISTLVEQACKDNGLTLTANLWLPGDAQPKGLLLPLKKPTIVVDVVDRSGITGPTGTFLDGIITDVVDLLGSTLGQVLKPFLNPRNEYAPEGVNIAPALGVNFHKPWVLFQDHPKGGLREWHLNGHHPMAHTVIGGGKSPKWINDLINATFEWFIDAISIAIGITGIPSDLLNGTLDDVFLAFSLVEHSDRRKKAGPFCWPEYFVQTGAGAYTLDEWFALMSASWDTRGYHSIQLQFDNGYPYTVGKDLFMGGLASFAVNNQLYTDYLDRLTVVDNRQGRAKVTAGIGDGKAQESPIKKIQRKLVGFEEFVQIVTLSSN